MAKDKDLNKINFFDKDMADGITNEGKEKLRELKASLDKHIKGVKENELEEIGELSEEATKALNEVNEKSTRKVFGNLQPTPEQRVEERLNKRVSELEERVQKLESYLWQQSTKGYIKKQ